MEKVLITGFEPFGGEHQLDGPGCSRLVFDQQYAHGLPPFAPKSPVANSLSRVVDRH